MIKFTVHDNFNDNKYPLPSLPWHTATGLKSATENLRLAYCHCPRSVIK